MNYIAKLYRMLVAYLNDSSDLTTGSHRGAPQCCSLYSGLSTMSQDNSRD
ncbi:MAG: hypothetical protein JO174_17590 [Herbaspirillum sp.]|nr:hypothetical protein [Herbaspirillum sp.]